MPEAISVNIKWHWKLQTHSKNVLQTAYSDINQRRKTDKTDYISWYKFMKNAALSCVNNSRKTAFYSLMSLAQGYVNITFDALKKVI